MKWIFLIPLFLLASCASGPSKDVCSVEKHDDDDLYQVKINDEPVNKFWYLKEDALEITATLAKQNKCMPNAKVVE